jgi:ligand-binding SRPBCC domain-containing protein
LACESNALSTKLSCPPNDDDDDDDGDDDDDYDDDEYFEYEIHDLFDDVKTHLGFLNLYSKFSFFFDAGNLKNASGEERIEMTTLGKDKESSATQKDCDGKSAARDEKKRQCTKNGQTAQPNGNTQGEDERQGQGQSKLQTQKQQRPQKNQQHQQQQQQIQQKSNHQQQQQQQRQQLHPNHYQAESKTFCHVIEVEPQNDKHDVPGVTPPQAVIETPQKVVRSNASSSSAATDVVTLRTQRRAAEDLAPHNPDDKDKEDRRSSGIRFKADPLCRDSVRQYDRESDHYYSSITDDDIYSNNDDDYDYTTSPEHHVTLSPSKRRDLENPESDYEEVDFDDDDRTATNKRGIILPGDVKSLGVRKTGHHDYVGGDAKKGGDIDDDDDEMVMIDNIAYESSASLQELAEKSPDSGTSGRSNNDRQHICNPDHHTHDKHGDDDDDDEGCVMIDNVAYESSASLQELGRETKAGLYGNIFLDGHNDNNGDVDVDDDDECVMIDNVAYESSASWIAKAADHHVAKDDHATPHNTNAAHHHQANCEQTGTMNAEAETAIANSYGGGGGDGNGGGDGGNGGGGDGDGDSGDVGCNGGDGNDGVMFDNDLYVPSTAEELDAFRKRKQNEKVAYL